MKKLISFCLVLLFIFTSVLAVTADNLEAQKSQIDKSLSKLQKDIKNAAAEKDRLQNEVNYIKSVVSKESEQYTELVEELEYVSQQLDSVTIELDESEKALVKQQEMCKTRLRAMYEVSSTSKLNILLNCKSLTEFFEIIEGMRVLSRQDKQIVEQLKVDREEIELKLEMQKQQLSTLQNSINEKKERLNLLTVSRAEKEKNLKETADLIRKYEQQQEELLKESREIEKEIKSKMSSSPYTQGQMLWPVPSATTYGSGFGMRKHPIYKVYKMHTGIDIGAKKNADIVAANDGVVIIAGWTSGYGNRVVIDHGGKISTLYAHCNKLLVKVGQKVKRGQTIALIGSTGTATGPHCHFEVRENGTPVNPINAKYLKK